MRTDRQRDFLDPMTLKRLSRLEICARGLVEGSFSGRHRSPHRGSSVEFAEYRKYTPGDDIGYVDWRVYGRSDRFYVKEFEADTNLRCYLVLDSSGSMAFSGAGPAKIKWARELTATLAHLLVHQGDAVGLQCFNSEIVNDIPPRSNPRHLQAVFDVIEKTEASGTTDIVNVLHDLAERIRRRSLVVVVSDLFTPIEPLLDCFHHLVFRKHDLAVFQVIDEQELSFDFSRPVRFVDLETHGAMVTDPGLIRNRYLAAIHGFLDQLRRGCLEFNIDYRLASTSESCEAVLSRFLLDRLRKQTVR